MLKKIKEEVVELEKETERHFIYFYAKVLPTDAVREEKY